ncbi:MAG: hypothetical protein JO202_14260, partial [Ktedonobacteraceae bacterium]|nr:hypothetical protein [Ktedonobacteraceae bacterium]
GLELGWKLDHSQQPSGSMLLVSREVYEHERHLLTLGQGAVNEHGLVLTIQATLREVLALGVALQSYKLQLERQPSVTPQQQEALELVSMLHDRLVASLSSSSK